MTPEKDKVEALLKASRQELLDLGFRNSLLNHHPSTTRGVEVVDELSREVFKIVAKDKKTMSFLHNPEADKATPKAEQTSLSLPGQIVNSSWPVPSLAQPEDKGSLLDKRYTDRYLQTRLSSAKLQSKLLKTFYFARTSLEEQGVNILYLALGMLIWEEAGETGKIRRAPLLLIPVELERANANTRFSVRYTGQELGHNLSLEAKLHSDFHIALPTLPENAGPEDVNVDQYFRKVEQEIRHRPGWRIERNEIVLDFFSFGKFLMYKDLDPESWPDNSKPLTHPIIRTLFDSSFKPAANTAPTEPLDNYLLPGKMNLVMDADSSQLEAILEVQQDQNLVIQGPPGTGKSQTITNIIAQALGDGKTVLFVTEKMAALEVVKQRLDSLGLGQACLELHSHKAEKKKVLAELKNTSEMTRPAQPTTTPDVLRFAEQANRLAIHSLAMITPIAKSGLTLYQILGELSDLRQSYSGLPDFKLIGLKDWTEPLFETRRELLQELVTLLGVIGDPLKHPFYGAQLTELIPTQQNAIESKLTKPLDLISQINQLGIKLADPLNLSTPADLYHMSQLQSYGQRVIGFLPMKGANLSLPEWTTQAGEIQEIFSTVNEFKKLINNSQLLFKSEAWNDVDKASKLLTTCLSQLTKLEQTALQLIVLLNITAPGNLSEAEKLIFFARRLIGFPWADGLDLTLAEWRSQVQGIKLIFDTATQLMQLHQRFDWRLRPEAWQQEVRATRDNLAKFGFKWLRNLDHKYNTALNHLNSLRLDQTPLELPAQLELLDAIIMAQQLHQTFQYLEPLGQTIFRGRWQGLASNWQDLQMLAYHVVILQNEVEQGFYPPGILNLGQFSPPQLAFYADTVTEYEKILNTLKEDFHKLLAFFKVGEIAPFGTESFIFAQTFVQQRQLLEALQKLQDSLIRHEPLAKKLFEQRWQGFKSDWEELDIFTQAVQLLRRQVKEQLFPASLLDFLSQSSSSVLEQYSKEVAEFEIVSKDLKLELTSLLDLLKIDEIKGFGGVNYLENQSFSFLEGLITGWHRNLSDLRDIVTLNQLAERCKKEEILSVYQLAIGQTIPANFVSALRKNWLEALLEEAFVQFPHLKAFNFTTQEQTIATFSRLDKATLIYNQKRLALKHWHNLPDRGKSHLYTAQEIAQLKFLEHEMGKMRAHKAIRKLIEKSGQIIQRMKPVFMMSPLSVAQFLEPGVLSFDLVIFDEASQIKPVDGFGAILRGRQVVVVGDDKQLPPTSFFEKVTQGNDSDEESSDEFPPSETADLESILSLLKTRFDSVMLNWHYRSRHESLIAISNNLFYNSKLVVFPSPDAGRKDSGLIYHHLANAIYDRGRTRTNPIEADIVAKAVIDHISKNPQQSLGVATFSVSQRDAIIDQLEILRRQHPNVEDFFTNHNSEPFFVKNLENVQGDERDVILISTGYGRDTTGKVNLNFGPLTAQGGERRLNVLISRARQRCEVFTNLTPDDIDFTRSESSGNRALHAFLEYAKNGNLPPVSGRQHLPSPIGGMEKEIAANLQANGYTVELKIGPVGNEMDLAVRDPANPARYLIGIELDGPIYGQAATTRDRDRLRPQVLRDLGWYTRRVWSLEWFLNPGKETARLLATIDAVQRGVIPVAPKPASPSVNPGLTPLILTGGVPDVDFIQTLQEMVTLRGLVVIENADLFHNLFNDLKPPKTEPWQRYLLEQVVREGIARTLWNQRNQTSSYLDRKRWSQNLTDNQGLDPNRVEWAIECWHKALEKIKD